MHTHAHTHTHTLTHTPTGAHTHAYMRTHTQGARAIGLTAAGKVEQREKEETSIKKRNKGTEIYPSFFILSVPPSL